MFLSCLLQILLAYHYCESKFKDSTKMLEVCPDSLQCAKIDQESSIFNGMNPIDADFKTCSFSSQKACDKFCSEPCIPVGNEVSYIGFWNGISRSDWLGGFVCPRGKYNAGVGLEDVPIDTSSYGYCFSKTWINGTRIYLNISAPASMGCNMYTAAQGVQNAIVPELLLNKVEYLLFEPFGFTQNECNEYCKVGCIEKWETPGVAVRNRTEKASGLKEYMGYVVGPFYCPKGEEKMPAESQKTDEELEEEDKSLGPATIAGIVIGCLIFVTLITLGIIWYLLKARDLSLPKLIKERSAKAKALRDSERAEHKQEMKQSKKGIKDRIL